MAKKDTTASFIEKARKVHGDRFDYSKVDYANSFSKVCIIDTTNNKEFWQLPYIHLQGCGNPEDTNEKRKKSLRFSKEEFEEKAKKVHGDKYDYERKEQESPFLYSLRSVNDRDGMNCASLSLLV